MKSTRIYMYNPPLSLHHSSARSAERMMSENIPGKNQILKIGIWLYFILLIFEGALRKWFLPGLSTPLLIIRDPVALWLILMSVKKGLLPQNIYLNCMFVIGLIGIFIAIFFDHGDLAVALYGARILIIHFPLIFIIGNIFNRDDVERLGRVLIFMSIPMVLLIATQFYSPQSAWVNRGVGGDLAGAGFSGALGFYRPPGTFSFTNGNALFFAFVASFVIYFWLNPKNINRIVLAAATIGLIAAIPLSISRSLFFSIFISVSFALIATLRKPQFIGHVVLIAGIGFISLGLLKGTKFFTTSTKAFTARFENANKAEGGITGVVGTRFIGGMSGSLMKSSKIPFLGYGLGMGTNAGAMLLTGNRGFLFSEEEWGRVIGELGPILGISVILIRLSLVAKMALFSIRKLNNGDLLPWMLLSFAVVVIPDGQWAQPTSLGFATLVGGLIIASLRRQWV
jgi:hypothetical protein